jgi:hypothetical protein
VPKVVITMPAYRAEQTLAQTVAEIPRDVADLLILVDDASPDNTAALARELGIDVYVHSENRGYGGNQKTCYAEAVRSGADVVVLLHPDYQYEPKAVPLLIAPILAGDADMTFGSRFAGLGDPIGGGMPRYRYVGNRVTTVLENVMLGSHFSEMHSGLRAYTRRCLLSLPFLGYSDDFLFDSQFLVDAVTSGQRVVEVPIPTRYTKESSSIAIGRSLRYIVGSLHYCARRAASRGRRGRRSPVAHPERGLPTISPALPRIAIQCLVCGADEHVELSRRVDGGGLGDGVLQCARCGFVSPRTGADERSRNGERDRPAATNEGRQVVERMLEMIGGYVVRGDDLLAVGRNASEIANLAINLGWRTETAREGELPAPAPGTGATARSARTRLDLQRERFDAVVLFDSLGPAPVEQLRRVRPLLDPTGILAVAAPHLAPARGRRGAASAPAIPDRYFFTAAALWTALGRAGFRMVEWAVPGSYTAGAFGTRVRARVSVPERSEMAAVRSTTDPGGTEAAPFGLAIARSSDLGASGGPAVAP